MDDKNDTSLNPSGGRPPSNEVPPPTARPPSSSASPSTFDQQPSNGNSTNDVQLRRMREIFALFDKERKGAVPQEEIGAIMRAMGVYPTERQWTKEYLEEMQGQQQQEVAMELISGSTPSPNITSNTSTGYILYEKVENKIMELLQSHACEADSEDVLLQAFRTLDTEDQGFLTTAQMRELLMSHGHTPFREKEVEAFLSVARDMERGHIYYEDYIRYLTASLDGSLSASALAMAAAAAHGKQGWKALNLISTKRGGTGGSAAGGGAAATAAGGSAGSTVRRMSRNG